MNRQWLPDPQPVCQDAVANAFRSNSNHTSSVPKMFRVEVKCEDWVMANEGRSAMCFATALDKIYLHANAG